MSGGNCWGYDVDSGLMVSLPRPNSLRVLVVKALISDDRSSYDQS